MGGRCPFAIVALSLDRQQPFSCTRSSSLSFAYPPLISSFAYYLSLLSSSVGSLSYPPSSSHASSTPHPHVLLLFTDPRRARGASGTLDRGPVVAVRRHWAGRMSMLAPLCRFNRLFDLTTCPLPCSSSPLLLSASLASS